jgi:hypothetical protein
MRRLRLLWLALPLLGLMMAGSWFWPRRLDEGTWQALEASLAAHRDTLTQTRYAVLLDFRRPMWQRRLWLIDLISGEVSLNAHVFHALGSGRWYARELSNQPNSQKSCAGTFLAAEAYHGQFGYAMRLDGLEPGRNDQARARFIVCHQTRFWPYTRGCFGMLPRTNQRVIDAVHGGGLWLCVR